MVRQYKCRLADDGEMDALPCAKRGRPLLLGEELDNKVVNHVKCIRDHGGVVTGTIMIATARGILGEVNKGLLAEHGGHINLTRTWAESLIERLGWSKRRGTRDCRATPHNLPEITSNFHEMVSNIVKEKHIEPYMIVNFDQTGVNIVPTSAWTLYETGAKQVPIAGVDDKRQVTMVLANTPLGTVLPPQVVYKGTTNRCHPTYNFPKDWDITHSVNHWSNEETMLTYVRNILHPYFVSKRVEFELAIDHPALVILDVFQAHRTKAFKKLLEDKNICMVYVPASCTGSLQPLDVSGNGDFKKYLKDMFIDWYSSQISKQKVVDMKLSSLKPTHAKWMVEAWSKFKSNPHLSLHGWRKTGLLKAVGIEVEHVEDVEIVEVICEDIDDELTW
jgi:hypothetical protein